MPPTIKNKRIGKPTILATATSLIAITTLALWALENQRTTRVDSFKQQRLVPPHTIKYDMKSTRGFALSILAIEESQTHLRLRGTITVEKPIDGLEFNWILPEGYTITGADARGVLPALRTGEKYDLAIDINRAGLPAQAIVLHVFRMVAGEPQGQIVQFDPDSSTRREALDSSPAKIKLAPGERLIQ